MPSTTKAGKKQSKASKSVREDKYRAVEEVLSEEEGLSEEPTAKKACVSPELAGIQPEKRMAMVATLVHTIGSHSSDVNWVDFNNKVLATCSGDKTVRLWSLDGYSELPRSPLCDHSYTVYCCVFSPFGGLLASCSMDGKVILWDTNSWDKVGTFMHPSKYSIRSCRFSPNSKLLVTGSDDETLCLWDVQSRKLIR